MRSIRCVEHGKVIATPPEDAARGLFTRYTHGRLIYSVVCDLCGEYLPGGTEVVAFSVPHNMPEWESAFLFRWPPLHEIAEPAKCE